jgi:hypothetical protein
MSDRDFRAVISSPRTLVENLVRVLHLPGDVLLPHVRVINLPGISASIEEMIDSLVAVGGQDKLRLLKEEPNRETERILRSWAPRVDDSTAMKLNLVRDESVERLVRDYWEEMETSERTTSE